MKDDVCKWCYYWDVSECYMFDEQTRRGMTCCAKFKKDERFSDDEAL